MQAAKRDGYRIIADIETTIYHADLGRYRMGKQTAIKFLTSCAGLWGAASEGDVLRLDANIAESLVRGGLAEYVEEQPRPKESDPKPKSKPA
jgi:hypothetical protein